MDVIDVIILVFLLSLICFLTIWPIVVIFQNEGHLLLAVFQLVFAIGAMISAVGIFKIVKMDLADAIGMLIICDFMLLMNMCAIFVIDGD